MAEHTGISWTESTWNPWHGCTKVSPGCKHCYMFTEKKQYGQDPTKVVRSKTKFSDPLKWNMGRLIFTCSWSDFFHEAADPWRDEAWEIIRRTPQHTYQILTKRPKRMAAHLPWADDPWLHVWLGVSVENQDYLWRLDKLAEIPAYTRFVSAEPLLGEVNLLPWLEGEGILDWVIVGGESGPKARPMQPDWARFIRDQCAATETPFFFKQWGGRTSKAGGKMLDGREWCEMPH